MEFLADYKLQLINSKFNFLKPQENVDDVAQLLTREVIPIRETDPLVTLVGPKTDRGKEPEIIQLYGDKVCTQTVSTYPLRIDRGDARDGDPVCDRYGLHLYKNRIMVVVADGCNWGEMPKRAADRARNTILKFLLEKHSKIATISDAKNYLLLSLNEAHKKICEKSFPEEEIGSTTAIVGLSLEVKGINGEPEWIFICASVGDCKAFLIEPDPLAIKDITYSNRANTTHSSDCGGRLGPVLPGGVPDLRNLQVYCCKCKINDIIMIVSDGVHDNLHPAMLNVLPKDLKINFDTWQQAQENSIDIETVASNFRVEFLKGILRNKPISTNLILDEVMKFSHEITKSSRDFMQTNPGKRLPKDYELYPGKMDHTTCILFEVGYIEPSPTNEPVAPLPIIPTIFPRNGQVGFDVCPITVTIATSPQYLTIYCRTIAKGKFECLAKKTECILTVSPRKLFEKEPAETIIGTDELSCPITRVVKIPSEIRINVHSKNIAYNPESGIISIRFALLP